MSEVAPPRVFISYSHDSRVHEERVLGLSERLRGDGIDVALDQYVEGSPAQGWPRWMLDCLGNAERVLVVCTETYYRRFRGHEAPEIGKGADWEGAQITQQLYNAKSRTGKFIAVLFGDEDAKWIPEPLGGQSFHRVDSDAGYEGPYDVLLRQAGVEPGPLGTARCRERRRGEALKFEEAPPGAAPKTAPRFGVPELPTHFLPRKALLKGAKDAVLSNEARVGITAAGRTGFQGLGGVGKSVLAATLARDPDVEAAFPDGLYWLTLGEQPDVLALQRALLQWSTGERDVRVESVLLGAAAIEGAFAEKRSLVVLDDVWRRQDVDGFVRLGASCRLVLTTRDREILTDLGAHRVDMEVLDPDEALELLATWTGKAVQDLPPQASEVARECGYLPLAVTLVGAQVHDGAPWQDVLDALRDGDVRFLDYADRSVFKALDASVRRLSQDEAECYRDLAFVPEEARVPESVIVCMWAHDEGKRMKEREARARIRTFANKALLFLDGAGNDGSAHRYVRLHDLQRDYLRLTAQDPQESHRRLVDAHFVALPALHGTENGPLRWASLPADRAYLWEYLIYHLLEAGRLETADSLVRNAKWLSAKAGAGGVASLFADLTRVLTRVANDDVARIAGMLRLEVGWLHHDPTALPGLLYNRLRSHSLSEPEIARVANGLRPAVRLRHPVRMGEGKAFRGHTSAVTACAYSPDGARVLSASRDNTMREWDRENGRELRRFDGHTSFVTACAYSPDGAHVLSASYDTTMREWDRENGRQLDASTAIPTR